MYIWLRCVIYPIFSTPRSIMLEEHSHFLIIDDDFWLILYLHFTHGNKLYLSSFVEWYLMSWSDEFGLQNSWIPFSIIDQLAITLKLAMSCFSNIINRYASPYRLLNMSIDEQVTNDETTSKDINRSNVVLGREWDLEWNIYDTKRISTDAWKVSGRKDLRLFVEKNCFGFGEKTFLWVFLLCIFTMIKQLHCTKLILTYTCSTLMPLKWRRMFNK